MKLNFYLLEVLLPTDPNDQYGDVYTKWSWKGWVDVDGNFITISSEDFFNSEDRAVLNAMKISEKLNLTFNHIQEEGMYGG